MSCQDCTHIHDYAAWQAKQIKDKDAEIERLQAGIDAVRTFITNHSTSIMAPYHPLIAHLSITMDRALRGKGKP